jgi:hypothetical protein
VSGVGPRARVLRWSAWAPGRDTAADWEAWAHAPTPLAEDGHPEARFLPPMLRRRCTPLTKIVLTAAYDCLEEAERDAVRTVFASRHGGINESIELLEAIGRGERLSPAKFSHGVHNAQAALFGIATGNRQASSSLAGGADTFSCGWIEASTHLEREPERPVLYVMGDVPVAPVFAGLVDEPPGTYALALLLGAARAGPAIELGATAEPAPHRGWPDALEFLRWLLAGEPVLALGRFRWTRSG